MNTRKIIEKGQKPDDIPSGPRKTYKNNGWLSCGDWLGTGRIADQIKKRRTFKEARSFVRGLGLKSSIEWRKYCKGELKNKGEKPDDIPSNPQRTYKNNGWLNWRDWLGTGK